MKINVSSFLTRRLRKCLVARLSKQLDSHFIPVEIMSNYIEYEGRELDCAVVRDVTERRRAEEAQSALEEQLRQAQKMESIGRLAGGVAHDFNNQLSIIQIYGDIIGSQMSADDPFQEKIARIQQASRRAADITGQLLACSRHCGRYRPGFA